MDTIFIQELRLDILIGIHAWERRVRQTVQFDLEIGLPGAKAGRTDRIADTIDYSKVVARLQASLAGERFLLLEKLAEHTAQLILAEFRAPWVKVSVTKLGAVPNVKRLGVTIERGEQPARAGRSP
ncbi:MAG: dihydroneopterin aldolase [Betaproteobacteria bacterium]|nr:dihydroneopterin aldolase [Betaproteobacteria bacterium]